MNSISISLARLAMFGVAAASLAGGTVALAEEETYPKISGTAAFVSDYRFRGTSFSDRDPAVQASLTLTTKPGFFFSAWGSSIADFNGATTEIDLIAGWSGSLGPLSTSVGVTGYLYPGGTDTDVVEFFGTIGGTLGPANVTVGLNWAPNQDNLSSSSRYLFTSVGVGIPNSPITLKGSLGQEQGALVVDGSGQTTKKVDWLVGADVAVGPLTMGIAYVGNDLPARNTFNQYAKDGFVFSISASF